MTTDFLKQISSPQSTDEQIDHLRTLVDLSQLAANDDARHRLSDNLRAASSSSGILARKASLEGLYLALSNLKGRMGIEEKLDDILTVIEQEHQKAKFAHALAQIEEFSNSDAYPREHIAKMLHELADAVSSG